jgi:hypothetical protein
MKVSRRSEDLCQVKSKLSPAFFAGVEEVVSRLFTRLEQRVVWVPQHKLGALVALLFQLRLQGALTEEQIDMAIRVAACERGP